jgi:alkyl hydroperoxide reductase subunit AhpC
LPMLGGSLACVLPPLTVSSWAWLTFVGGLRACACSGTFIIDPNGILRHINVNDNNIGRSVEENIRIIQAIQYADTHGEVCPANWKPGEATMKAEVKASKSYFSQKFEK